MVDYLSLYSGFSFRNGVVSKTILRSSLNFMLVSHSTVALSSSLSSLQGPVVTSSSWVGISAFRTGLLLNVIGLVAASSTGAMNFGMSFTETLSTFSLHK